MPVTQTLPDGPYAQGSGTPGPDMADIVTFLTQKGTATDAEMQAATSAKLNTADLAASVAALADGSFPALLARDSEVATAKAEALAASQPLDSDLTAIAALTTTAYGRALLTQADAAAGRASLSLGTAATVNTGTAAGNVPVLGADAKLPAAVVPPTTITNVVEGQQLLAYGHSYSAGAGGTNGAGYLQRLTRRLSLSTIFNRYQSATTSYTAAVQKTQGDHNFLTAANGFFVNFDSVINDASDSENTGTGGGATAPLQAASIAKLTNMVKYLLTLTQRRSNLASTSGVYTGTWTANTGDVASPIIGGNGNGTSSSTTTMNDSVTFSGLTANAKVSVMLQGIDNFLATPDGAAFSITSAGMTTVTGTTGNQFYGGRDGNQRGPMIVVVQLTGGATSLTITKTDATGTILYVNGTITIDQQFAPWVILVKNPYVTTVADVTVDRHNAALDAAKAALASPGIVIVDPNAAGWNKTIHTSTFDTLHPNDRGHGFLADTYAAAVFATPYHVATAGNQRNSTSN